MISQVHREGALTVQSPLTLPASGIPYVVYGRRIHETPSGVNEP